jgi:hypothetical protein
MKKNTTPRRVTRVEVTHAQEPLPEDPRPDLPRKVATLARGNPAMPFQAERYVPWGAALARRGLKRDEIAKVMRVGKTKLYEWIRQHPEFAKALEAGRDEAAARVENAMLERAIGFDVEESRIVGRPEVKEGKPVFDESGKPRIVPEKVERVKKRVLGDVQAQLAMLRVLAPDRWREKVGVELSGTLTFQELVRTATDPGAQKAQKSKSPETFLSKSKSGSPETPHGP